MDISHDNEELISLRKLVEAQASATEKLTRSLEQALTKIEDQGQTIKSQGQTVGVLGQTIGVQGERIELLEGEVRGLKETSSSSNSITAERSSEAVQTGSW